MFSMLKYDSYLNYSAIIIVFCVTNLINAGRHTGISGIKASFRDCFRGATQLEFPRESHE